MPGAINLNFYHVKPRTSGEGSAITTKKNVVKVRGRENTTLKIVNHHRRGGVETRE